jgi:hypothetical protein
VAAGEQLDIVFTAADYTQGDEDGAEARPLPRHLPKPTTMLARGLPACSQAPMDGAKDDDGGVEAAICSSAATSSTLDDNDDDDIGPEAAGVRTGVPSLRRTTPKMT